MDFRTRLRAFGGYLGLLVVVANIAIPLALPSLSLLQTLILGLGLPALGICTSLSGIRFGQRMGKLVAYVAFIAALYFALTFIIVSINH
jgi:hypothetical protein